MGEVQSFELNPPVAQPMRHEQETSGMKEQAREIVRSLKELNLLTLDEHGKEIRESTGFSPAEVMRSLSIITELALGELSDDSKFLLAERKITLEEFLRRMQSFASLVSAQMVLEGEIPPKSKQH